MSDDAPSLPLRRALIIFYDDETNTVEVDDSEFGWLEVAELLRTALDYAEMNAPNFAYDESEQSDE